MIFIGCPSATTQPAHARCITALSDATYWTPAPSPYICLSRDRVVAQFRATRLDRLLILDGALALSRPADVLDMLAFVTPESPVLGVPCPDAGFNTLGIATAVRKGIAGDQLQHYALKFRLGNFIERPTLDTLRSPIKVQHVPLGAVLIHRALFDLLEEAHPDRRYIDHEQDEPRVRFFRADVDPTSGFFLPDDVAFCRDVIALGLPVHAALWVALNDGISYADMIKGLS